MVWFFLTSLAVQLLAPLRRIFTGFISSDSFQRRAPAFVIALAFPCDGFAAADLTLSAASRSYPLSGAAEAEAGYGAIIWGDPSSPLYGYTRLEMEGSSAFTYNSLGASAEVYPLSFLGVRAGGEGIQNDHDYSAYDCERYQCLGRYYRTYIEGELSLGYAGVFVQGRWRRERWTQKDPEQNDFIDPTSGLLMKAAGDAQTVYHGAAGWKASDTWTYVAVLRYAEGENLRGFSRFPALVVRYTSGPYSAGLGGGVFESDLKSQGFAAVCFLRWEVAPSVALK